LSKEVVVGVIIGAFLAAVFGYISSICLEKWKEKKQRYVICGLIVNELSALKRRLEMAKQITDKFCCPVFSRFVRVNSFKSHKGLLLGYFRLEEFKDIEELYDTHEHLDEIMEMAIHTKINNSNNDEALRQMHDALLGIYWELLCVKLEDDIVKIGKLLVMMEAKYR